ncbi:sensor histidine kinase [Flavobacterium sp.]|uniref:sensor histidine kinase n=1 Tax=Flavobacterium sp. TaxID=239 RepID=UPI0039E3ADB0
MGDIVIGIVIGMIFISLVLSFCVVLIRLYFIKIKNYTSLLYQKDLDFQKALNLTIIETQEQVLNNISQDLHDDAGQQLTYINLQLENLKLDSEELQQTLTPVSESVANLSQSIRNISHALNNQLLMQQDLFKAMQAESKRLQHNGKINITFSIKGKNRETFTLNEKIFIYRIFQEALNNCFKHAKASKIDIHIQNSPGFSMVLSDDGIGFEPKNAGDKISLGIKSMKQRAEIINYTLDIESAPMKGTTVKLFENQTN